MEKEFDIVVIGGGPGGYVAAIRAAQLGYKTAIVEKHEVLGGTCLNVGCIPSKALLDSSELYHLAQKKFATHGIEIKGLKLDFKQMMKRKQEVVTSTTKGIDFLMKKNKIEQFKGVGCFISQDKLLVNGSKKQEISSKRFILATGSKPMALPGVPVDGVSVITSTEALALEKIPKHLVVIGGGVIGVELSSVYARLGAKVSIVEYRDGLLPTMDRELGKALERSLKQLKIECFFNTKVTGLKKIGKEVILSTETREEKETKIKGDLVLVGIGRQPYTDGLGLDKIGVHIDDRGRIEIDEDFKTNISNIYAIGDVVKGPMLAHKASEEAVVCVEKIHGQKPHLNYHTIPGVVYTWPEVASVGYSEEQLKTDGKTYKVGKYPFKASGRARAAEEFDGFIKILSDKRTDEILGIHMIGPRAADLIGEAVVAMEYRASAEDIGTLVHAHPTFSEAIKEAALESTSKRAIHI